MTWRTAGSAAAILLVLIYAFGSGLWVQTGDGWYRSLVRPPWQPPDVVFGLIWPYNFIVLGAVGVAVMSGGPVTRAVWLGCLAASVVGALTWARLFYVSHSLWASGFALGAAALLTVPLVVIAFRHSLVSGAVMVPYVLWLGIAASLAFGYAARN
jgi:tryptophan-rich sensory protein